MIAFCDRAAAIADSGLRFGLATIRSTEAIGAEAKKKAVRLCFVCFIEGVR